MYSKKLVRSASRNDDCFVTFVIFFSLHVTRLKFTLYFCKKYTQCFRKLCGICITQSQLVWMEVILVQNCTSLHNIPEYYIRYRTPLQLYRLVLPYGLKLESAFLHMEEKIHNRIHFLTEDVLNIDVQSRNRSTTVYLGLQSDLMKFL